MPALADTPLTDPVPASWWRRALGWGLGLAGLAWVFHDLGLREVAAAATSLSWGWIPLAVGLDVLSYLCQGWRWSLLLRPVGRLSPLRATQGVYIGLFTNEVAPLRLGEAVRTWAAARWLRAPVAAVVPSLVVERLFDGVWLLAALGLVIARVPLPAGLVRGAYVLGATVGAAAVLGVALALRQRRRVPPPGEAPPRAGGRWATLLRHVDRLALGLVACGGTRDAAASFGISALVLLCQIAAFWLVMVAAGLSLPPWAGAAVLLIVHLGTAVPNAPSNLGTYQFFTVVGLALFGVDKTVAAAFSLVVFVILTVPLWLIGLLALGRAGIGLRAIRRRIAGTGA